MTTAPETLAERLAKLQARCDEKAEAYPHHAVAFRVALEDAYRAGELITRAEVARLVAEAVEKEREGCARVAEEGLFLFDIDVWLESTKKEMTEHTGHAIAAAIRARAAQTEKEG